MASPCQAMVGPRNSVSPQETTHEDIEFDCDLSYSEYIAKLPLPTKWKGPPKPRQKKEVFRRRPTKAYRQETKPCRIGLGYFSR